MRPFAGASRDRDLSRRALFPKDQPLSFRMLAKASLALLFVGGLASLLSALGPAANAETPPGSAIPEEAMVVITRMGKTLQASQFSFHSHTFRAYAGPNGE